MAFFMVLIIIAFAIWVVGLHTRVATSRNGFRNAFAQIDMPLTRRNDLIPNLVETVIAARC